MFGVDDIKQTRLYRENHAEVRDKKTKQIVKNMLRRGDSVEAIAELVELDIQRVREIYSELEQEQN